MRAQRVGALYSFLVSPPHGVHPSVIIEVPISAWGYKTTHPGGVTTITCTGGPLSGEVVADGADCTPGS